MISTMNKDEDEDEDEDEDDDDDDDDHEGQRNRWGYISEGINARTCNKALEPSVKVVFGRVWTNC